MFPLFHGVSSWTSSSPADGWGSLAQRDVTLCVRFSTVLSCVVMFSVCETLLCACRCSGRGFAAPCLSLPTHRLPSPHGLEACGSFAGGALCLRAFCHFLYTSTAVIGARKRAVNRAADKEREPPVPQLSDTRRAYQDQVASVMDNKIKTSNGLDPVGSAESTRQH